MPRQLKIWVFCGLFVMVLVVGSVWINGGGSRFRKGRNINSYGLGCCADRKHVLFEWAPWVREKASSYFARTRANPAHFSGSIALCPPEQTYESPEIGILDGMLSYFPSGSESDPKAMQDGRVLKSSNLRTMLVRTRNDWRIINDGGHFVDPAPPFTGRVIVDPDGEFGLEYVIEVRDDIIVSTSRHPYIALD